LPAPKLNQLTPVLTVDTVEPGLAFWVDRFGFTAENLVPGPDGKLIFASAKQGDVEVMYQTKASGPAARLWPDGWDGSVIAW